MIALAKNVRIVYNRQAEKATGGIMNKITQILAGEFNLREDKVDATIKLIDEGNTIPFIARYRKEVTGNMSDEVLRDFDERLKYLTNLESRKEDVIRLIDAQGKLTDELKEKIISATTVKDVDDLYLPFRPKKRTRALIAIEKGLEPLADMIFSKKYSYDEIIKASEEYVSEEKGVKNADDALTGAKDILAERISEVAQYRKDIREMTMKYSMITTSPVKGMENEINEFNTYYEFTESVRTIPDHRILAIDRGEDKKVLKVTINPPTDTVLLYLRRSLGVQNEDIIMNDVIADSYKRLISPSIERECRASLTQRSHESSITVFSKNLKALLMAPPLKGKVIMGLDPAFRTGCKIAVIDKNGKYLDSTTVYPTEPQKKIEEARKILLGLIKKYGVEVISIGNGTASRESESFVAEMIRESGIKCDYVIVNEAGASVYSASEFATWEYPDLNVSLRGAISIAQRLKDPLSELVKIDPKHIGVGQYQHDVNQKRLSEALDGVVEDAVNTVGVEVNTASVPLLSYVSGINKKTANAIYEYVREHGGMKKREELKKVSGIGAKAYEQCAGFIRVAASENILDNTGVHPESYPAALALLKEVGYDAIDRNTVVTAANMITDDTIKTVSEKTGYGIYTLNDIVTELRKPGRDPREAVQTAILKSDVIDIKDLTVGMKLSGTVRNVTHFGAFVDIGVHEDGLVHISKLSDKYVKDPFEVVSVGDIVNVEVTEVDLKRNRISLSMKGLN